MRFGIGALVDVPMPAFAERARLAESLGFDDFWVPDERLLRNAYASLLTAANATERIRLGTAVTNPYTRNPALTAAAIATVDEASGGRAVLGMGAGGGLDAYGISRPAPASHLAEAVEVVRLLTAGGTVSFQGRHFSLTDTQLDFPPLRQVPIHLAARGPRILELAGRVADGVIIGGFAQEAGISWARQAVQRGLDAAGRGWADLETTAWVFVSVSPDRAAAQAAVANMVMMAMISSRPILEEIGVRLSPALTAFLDERGWAFGHDIAELAGLLTREQVDAFAVHGRPEDCVERLRTIAATGADNVGFVILPPAGDSVEDVAIRLAESVIPELQGG